MKRSFDVGVPLPTLVITGTLVSAAVREESVHAVLSIIGVYKQGSLAIQQAGKSLSARVVLLCRKCPLVRRGEFQRCSRSLALKLFELEYKELDARMLLAGHIISSEMES